MIKKKRNLKAKVNHHHPKKRYLNERMNEARGAREINDI